MKPINIVRISVIMLMVQFLMSCEEDSKPVTKIETISAIPTGYTTATVIGRIKELSDAEHGDYGFCYSINDTPSINDSVLVIGSAPVDSVTFSGYLINLTPSPTYYVRAYISEQNGYKYGAVKSITTDSNTVTDIDSNIYHIITIGTQVWMVENLKTTRYRNGDAIPNVTNADTWGGLITGAYCNYDNDSSNVASYGRLYNWYAVDDSRKLAPAGWHVASDSDWTRLENYLGGDVYAGGKLKEAGTAHWANPNTGADNTSGFTALPGGYREIDGTFNYLGNYGVWWSSTEYDAACARLRDMDYNYAGVYRGNGYKYYGFSVRCVKD